MRFAFIHAHRSQWHVRTMCRVLQVSRAGYYAWATREPSAHARADARLADVIARVHADVEARYGSPRVHRELKAQGHACGRHRVARLMREAGLRAKSVRRFRVTTQSTHAEPLAPNHLARQFAVVPPAPATPVAERPWPRVWVADLTYVPTREGWLYLAVILELASRRVVGWAAGARLDHTLALAALTRALGARGAGPGLHHSDRGVQYASAAYRAQLAAAGLTPSMSRRGDCWDNAVAESFFATLTKELLLDGVFASRAEAHRALYRFIEFWYNRQRRHSALGYRSPVQYEAEVLQAS
jgi:transposase InsO family protein